jgi:hypothetical protein
MAALVTNTAFTGRPGDAVGNCGPLLVALASETDLSTPDTSIVINTRGVSLMVLQLVFANYTSVTVKAQRSLGSTWVDITDATLSANGIIDFDPKSPQVRLSLAGTLSGSADSMSVLVYLEYMARK